MAEKAAERRFNQKAGAGEIRATESGEISVYAAVFYDGSKGSEFELWSGATERIAPGAFKRSIESLQDTRALFNHEPDKLLGRISAGTLKLEEDGRGLLYTISLGETSTARDVKEMIKRGDLTGSSFSFTIAEGGEEWRDTEEGRQIRHITDVNLLDVGPVTFPAYAGTSANSRSVKAAERSRLNHERALRLKAIDERINGIKKNEAEEDTPK